MLLALALPSHSAGPRTYSIRLDYSIGKQKMMSPMLVVHEGQEAEVEERGEGGNPGAFLAVKALRPKGGPENQIQLSLTLGKIEGEKRSVLGRPQIVLLENETAGMTMAGAGQPDLEVNATVKRMP